MIRHLLALGTFLSALCAFLAPAAFAAQDKFTPAPGGGPNPGYYINNMVAIGGPVPNMFIVAQRLGGVFQTLDSGNTWTPMSNGISGSAIIRFLNRKAGVGNEYYAATDGDAGFYRTTDSGANWSASNSGLGCRKVRSVLFDGTDIVLATGCDTNSGYYRSTDSGVTWARTWTSLPDDFRGWGFLKVDANNIYVNGNYGVYKTSNGGTSFSPANGTALNKLPTTVSSQIFAFTRRTGSGRLLAHAEGSGIYYSTDSGTNWFAASGLPADAFGFSGFAQPNSTDIYFAIDGAGLYKSTNDGVNWAPVSPAGLDPNIRQMFIDPSNANIWWASTLSGVYQSSGAGNNGSNYTWTKKSNGLVGGIHAAAVHATNDTTFLALGETAYKTVDGGATWSASGTGLGGTTGHNYSANVTSHSSAPDTFYATTTYQGVFKSTNAGGNWSAANSGITSKLKPQWVLVAPSDANTLYATALCGATGNPGGVYKSTNAGASWADVGTSASLTSKCANSISIHPTDPNTAYLATGQALYLGTSGGSLQSSNGNTMGGLYKTTNGGATWSFVNPGKVAFPVASPNILSSDPNKLLLRSYVTDNLGRATSVSGAYLSLDGGDSWRQLVSNERATQARFVQTPNGRVDAYIGTDGYFDEFDLAANGEVGFRCADIVNLEPGGGTCSRLRLPSGTRSLLRFVTKGNRVVAAATSSGIAMQSYGFLGPDFNNDGVADIWWRHTDGRNHIWNLMVPSSNDNAAVVVNPSTNGSTRTVGSPWVVAGFGDFNRDGHTDVLWRNTSSGDNYLFLMDNGAIVGEGYLPNVPPPWSVTAVGDFNGDGYADIWWNNGAQNYMYLLGVPSGTLPVVIGEGFMPAVYDANWSIAGTGDFNGDGKADIWYRNSSSGYNYLYLLNGMTITSEGYTNTVGTTWSIAGIGDFNGDGKSDVMWRESGTGYNYLYPMDGFTVMGTAGYLPTVSDTTWTVQGTGDTNKDGISDLLWRQSTTGYNFVWRMNGVQVQSICGQVGAGIGCGGGVLPVIDEPGWSIVNK